MTTGISLVRENTLSLQPPRALWVSFPLGRPLGKPGDAAFQLDVIRAALELLDRPQGPVLEDYPHDVPTLATDSLAACPVSFPRADNDDNSWRNRLAQEVDHLKPWYELSRRRRNGRTLVGVGEQSLDDMVAALAEVLDEGTLPTDVVWLKRAVEDIKAFYLEAMTAQPGDYDVSALQAQFWRDSSFAAAVMILYQNYQNSDDDRLKLIARILAPREAVGAATGPHSGNSHD